jgi:hypothetical protein
LKTTIIRRFNAIVFRNELKKIARYIEKIELRARISGKRLPDRVLGGRRVSSLSVVPV